jgi:hypothetical protein
MILNHARLPFRHTRKPPRGERRDLNPRPLGPQPSALPTELRSPRAPHVPLPTACRRSVGAPGRIRTCGPRIRSPLLCPAELQAHIAKSGRRDSNPRQPAWKAGALPTELHPPARACCSVGPWSGREDLNLRPPAPKAGALPGCATSRQPHLSGFGCESIAYPPSFRTSDGLCITLE